MGFDPNSPRCDWKPLRTPPHISLVCSGCGAFLVKVLLLLFFALARSEASPETWVGLGWDWDWDWIGMGIGMGIGLGSEKEGVWLERGGGEVR